MSVTILRRRRLTKPVHLVLASLAWAAVGFAQAQGNGLTISVPNGYATVSVDDLTVMSTAGPARWTRSWDGQEWKFNPHWESLSQSWKNLTGSQSADTTGGTLAASTSATTTALASSGGGSGGDSGCWVWVDEDWQPSVGETVIGGVPQAGPLLPERSTPFNHLMGEASADYPPPVRVSVDYASLCAGAVSSGGIQELEGLRRMNELYLGEAGRYAFDNRSFVEKRAVRALPEVDAASLEAQLAGGSLALAPTDNPKGFRWLDKGGDWIDYNTQGQVVAWGERNGNAVWLARDSAGQVRGVVDANGRVLYTLHYTGALLTEVRDYPVAGLSGDLPARSVHYQYDASNRLSQVTDARGGITRYAYDGQNRLTQITDAAGGIERLAYNGELVTQHTAADGGVTDYVFEYDDVNKQFHSKITGPATAAGRRVEDQTHNRNGQLVRRSVNGQIEEEIRYDTGARAEQNTNARGNTTRIVKNEFEQIVEIGHADGAVERRAYAAQHLGLVEVIDALGVKTEYQYDALGNEIKRIEAAGSSDERVIEYQVNALGQLIRTTRKGRTEADGTVTPDTVWQFAYDAQGQLSQTTDPEGGVRRYVYDRAGNLLAYTDPLGQTTRYQVDAHGNLTQVTDPLGHETRYAYDTLGNLTTYTDARGKALQLAYDAMSRNTRTTSPLGGVYQRQFNGQGLPVSETDADGRSTQAEYDNFLRLAKQIDGLGNATQYSYHIPDGSGAGTLGALYAPTQIAYPTYTQELRYDALERPVSDTLLNPTALGTEGLVSSRKYDKRGRVVEATNAEGKTSYYGYDAHGRITRFTDSLGKSIDFLWDVHGNLLQFKDYNGNATRFEYDRASRPVKQVLPLGQTTRYTYDAKGRLVSKTDANGNQLHHGYDAADRILRLEVTAAGEAAPSLVYTFSHDAAGNLTGWSDGLRGAAYIYDDEGRGLTETVDYGDGVVLDFAYTYSASGDKTALRYPDGTTIGYQYAAHGELSQIDIPGEGSLSVNEWQWLAPKKLTLPGGTTRELSHDGLLKLTGLKVRSPGQQTLLETANQYGKIEELTSQTLTDSEGSASATVSSEYHYDSEQRLLQSTRDSGGALGVSTETFTLDAAGNRVSHSAVSGTWVYDANNRLTQRGDTRYDYDANGNLITRTVGSSGTADSITRYQYDALNRLVEVQDGAGATLAKYAYDPFDNRLVKALYRDDNGAVRATPQRTHFLYADEGLIAEADGNGTVITQYGWKADGQWGTDPVFVKTAITHGATSAIGYAYLHNDHLGTPLRATDKAGKVVWRADYNSFGATTLGQDNALRNNLRLGGQYFDLETGLHYNTRRYYDPQTGRYLTSDPMGLRGGWNLYQYANSDPINELDPTGEWVWIAIRVAITVYDYYTEYKAIKEQGECYDWTRLIPIPIKVPKVKWLTKRQRQCSTACECMGGGGGAGGGPNSFPGNTLVHALDAQGQPGLRPIASLKLGDRVLAKSEWKSAAGSLSYEPVTDVFVTPNQPRTLVHLTLDDGQTLTATDGHPFKTTAGWRDAILLKKGGKLLLRGSGEDPDSERLAVIAEVRHENQTLTTYNLEVANAHTFYVGEDGVLVHNGRGGKSWGKIAGEVLLCGLLWLGNQHGNASIDPDASRNRPRQQMEEYCECVREDDKKKKKGPRK